MVATYQWLFDLKQKPQTKKDEVVQTERIAPTCLGSGFGRVDNLARKIIIKKPRNEPRTGQILEQGTRQRKQINNLGMLPSN